MTLRRLQVSLDFGWTAMTGALPSRALGVLIQDGPVTRFALDAGFLEQPLPVSPFLLPLSTELITHADRDFDYLPGLLADSLPDGWGRLLQDRTFEHIGRPRVTITAMDRLAMLGAAGMGALTFHPVERAHDDSDRLWPIDLAALAAQAHRLWEGSAETVLPELRLAGGSPGGARPKILVGLQEDLSGAVTLVAGVTPGMVDGTAPALPEGDAPWLVKFAAVADQAVLGHDIGALEEAYARMARAAGLEMPPTRLLVAGDGLRHFAVRRFDRHGPGGRGRYHMHTLAGLLHASHRMPSLDYRDVLIATRRLTRDDRMVSEVFRRAVFNVLAHNRDDHTRNLSFLMDATGTWALAPAYDLIFNTGMNGHHMTAVNGESANPTRDDLMAVAIAGGLTKREAGRIFDEVDSAVAAWPHFAAEVDLPAAAIRDVSQAIARVRSGGAARGFLRGIDTTVARDDDRI